MEIKRITEISIETSRQFVVRQAKCHEPVFCPTCGEAMQAAEQTAEVFRLSRRRVYQIIETGAAHFCETSAGAVMICLPSLQAILETGERLLGEAEETPGE